MLRIGIVGTENSHADHFVRHLNVDRHRPDARVVALAGGETDKNRTLATEGGIEVVADSISDVADQIDAAVVCDRDGGRHRANTLPLLEAGKHVFVDKPTATTTGDVRAMIAAARSAGAILASWSILRHAPGVEALRAKAADRTPSVITVTGPADPANPHAGLFFYGPHIVELALEALGNPTLNGDDVSVHRGHDVVTAIARAGGTQLVLNFVAGTGPMPWHVTVADPHDLYGTEITTDMLDHSSGLDRFVDAVLAGQAPDPHEQLVTPVTILAAVNNQLGRHTSS
ncbi:Gfo/Idh/MocA family protein [Phytoactinopolyspora halophila]|nr:Gfo/Idh/MocA family oxidoreductase [Phytoactinopolyspora halophila]